MLMNKPPRVFTKRTLVRVAERIDDNAALQALFHISLPRFPEVKEIDSGLAKESSSLLAYEGPLQGSQLQALGLI
jgi:hypothetical protein